MDWPGRAMLPFTRVPFSPVIRPPAATAGTAPLMVTCAESIGAPRITHALALLPTDSACAALPRLIAASPTPPRLPVRQWA